MKMGCSLLRLQLIGLDKGTLTWQLLVKTDPSRDARAGGRWAGSGSDIGLLRVQESERLRGREAETEA